MDEYQKQLVATLAKKADALSRLLKEPEVGLTSWTEAVAENAQFISDWWAGKMADRK